MPKGKTKFIPLIDFTVDILLLFLSFFIASCIRFGGIIPDNLFYYSLFLGWVILWIIIVLKFNLYEIPRIIYIHKVVSKNLKALLTFAFLSAALIYLITDYKFSRVFFVIAIVDFTVLVLLWRVFMVKFFKNYRHRGYNFRKIVLVGYNENMEKLFDKVFLNPDFGYQIEGFFTDVKLENHLKEYYKGTLDEVIGYCEENKVDDMIISLPHHKSDLINDLLRFGDNNMIRVKIIPEFSEYLSQVFSIEYIQNIPILKFREEPLQSLANRILKRGFDVVFSSLVVLLLFSWLFPVIAVIIKLTSKGPVFFSQERTGRNGIPFKCLKFRSMKVNAESDTLQATKGDCRITPFGAFMRKTSIDELPQILNVLANHMSLVGPRPHMLKHTDEYRVLVDKFMVRHFAKPGVTGWAQINGFRGETKTVQDMANRAEADIWYIENWSFMLDMRIIFMTVWTMLFRRDENAY
ncbi:undecaprenyl-phosphate glucose phosphotransferase [Lutibacter sp. B1]|uniref:undecaprenyl-phosphate glucose phosphotransferase n=1 Tax=Lutibacter sp. B1 TaxID=2725996 RepID=UPI0014576397|nr:undecaprenyl-phosphate glucose phosphotransferase [Lutibacter sp. B1]NLP58833.1 undecaprenyl-phosphate glucose phosphotransferase [Lutibacter sp. B1]